MRFNQAHCFRFLPKSYAKKPNHVAGLIFWRVKLGEYLDHGVDGRVVLLCFVTAHPPQALEDLFCEEDLKIRCSPKFFDGAKKSGLISLFRLTW